jgi:hypothetical protein
MQLSNKCASLSSSSRCHCLPWHLAPRQSLKRDNPHKPCRHRTKPPPKNRIQAGFRRRRPTDLARPWLQSMAATFVWAARDGVHGLHRLESSWRDRQITSQRGPGLSQCCSATLHRLFRPNAQRESIGTKEQQESWPSVASSESIAPAKPTTLAHSGLGGFPKLRRGRQIKKPQPDRILTGAKSRTVRKRWHLE